MSPQSPLSPNPALSPYWALAWPAWACTDTAEGHCQVHAPVVSESLRQGQRDIPGNLKTLTATHTAAIINQDVDGRVDLPNCLLAQEMFGLARSDTMEP